MDINFLKKNFKLVISERIKNLKIRFIFIWNYHKICNNNNYKDIPKYSIFIDNGYLLIWWKTGYSFIIMNISDEAYNNNVLFNFIKISDFQ